MRDGASAANAIPDEDAAGDRDRVAGAVAQRRPGRGSGPRASAPERPTRSGPAPRRHARGVRAAPCAPRLAARGRERRREPAGGAGRRSRRAAGAPAAAAPRGRRAVRRLGARRRARSSSAGGVLSTRPTSRGRRRCRGSPAPGRAGACQPSGSRAGVDRDAARVGLRAAPAPGAPSTRQRPRGDARAREARELDRRPGRAPTRAAPGVRPRRCAAASVLTRTRPAPKAVVRAGRAQVERERGRAGRAPPPADGVCPAPALRPPAARPPRPPRWARRSTCRPPRGARSGPMTRVLVGADDVGLQAAVVGRALGRSTT